MGGLEDGVPKRKGFYCRTAHTRVGPGNPCYFTLYILSLFVFGFVVMKQFRVEIRPLSAAQTHANVGVLFIVCVCPQYRNVPNGHTCVILGGIEPQRLNSR